MKKKYGELSLFGQRWTIFKSDELDAHINGLCVYDEQCIYVRSNLNADLFKRILFHEILHACFFRCSFYVTGIPQEVEEMVVDQVAQMFVENAKFLSNNLKITKS